MPMFTVNAHRIDPYSNFKFRVSWDNQPVAALSKMTAVKRMTEVIEWRAAGDSSIIRNLMLYGSYTDFASEGEYHGIHLRGRAIIREGPTP